MVEDYGWAPIDYPEVRWSEENEYDWPRIEWYAGGVRYVIGVTHEGDLQSSEAILRGTEVPGQVRILRSCSPCCVLTVRMWLKEFKHPDLKESGDASPAG